jgi:hypothetical protein
VATGQRIVIGTYAANYKARGALQKRGYTQCQDSDAVLRTYYAIAEDRLPGACRLPEVALARFACQFRWQTGGYPHHE